jgi:hypothetical protein
MSIILLISGLIIASSAACDFFSDKEEQAYWKMLVSLMLFVHFYRTLP